MRKLNLLVVLAIFSSLLISCGSKAAGPEKTVEAYINALAAKDSNRLSSLSCASWEQQALMELDSFQAVTSSVEGLACSQSGTDGDTTLVACTGKLVSTYNNENQQIDLSTRTYQVIKENGDWLVCGTR